MAGIEFIDGILKSINYFIDIFLTILKFLLKPILNNPSNFGNEPSVFVGNLLIGFFILGLYLIGMFIILAIIWKSSEIIVTDSQSYAKDTICLSISIEIIYLLIIGLNNFIFVKFLGDIIILSIIFYVIFFIMTFIKEKTNL